MGKRIHEKKPKYKVLTNKTERSLDLLFSYLSEKQARGFTFSEVEKHLLKNFSKLDNNLLGPSKLLVASKLVATFILPLLVIGTGLSLAKKQLTPMIGNAYETASMDELQNAAFQEESEAEEEIEEKQIEEEAALTLTFKQREVGDIQYQTSLIKFITGIIAVYKPNVQNPGEIARYIVAESVAQKVDPLYIAAVISAESAFSSYARSPVGALGLMQVMPQTGMSVNKQLTGKSSWPALTDPKINLQLGIKYLKDLEKRYRGNRYSALAAYNWGPANVDQARKSLSGRIPGSVQKYARTILERTLRWQSHYDSAVKNSADAEEAITSKTPV